MTKENLGFKFELKRFKKPKALPLLCPDYKPELGSFCSLAKKCKNAAHPATRYNGMAFCSGGTDPEEIKNRREWLKPPKRSKAVKK